MNLALFRGIEHFHIFFLLIDVAPPELGTGENRVGLAWIGNTSRIGSRRINTQDIERRGIWLSTCRLPEIFGRYGTTEKAQAKTTTVETIPSRKSNAVGSRSTTEGGDRMEITILLTVINLMGSCASIAGFFMQCNKRD